MKNSKKSLSFTLVCLIISLVTSVVYAQPTNKAFLPFDDEGSVTNAPGWANWFGGAFQGLRWNSSDASNNLSSGSLVITSSWSGASQQYVVMNNPGNFSANGFNPALVSPDANGYVITNFQCDIRYESFSATQANGTFGPISFGSRGTGFGQPLFGTVSIAATNTGWVHISMPIDVNASPVFASIPNVLIKMDTFGGGAKVGPSVLYVDNIKFVAGIPPVVPPTMSILPAKIKGLRIFAGSTGTVFDREEIYTADQNQSWIGGTYPVSYSFKLLSYDPAIGQTHIFLVPLNFSPQGFNGYNGLDYTASNGLWLLVNPQGTAGTVTASVVWKTNAPNSNPANVAVLITNSTAVGTWTLTFNSPSTGTLTAPGASPAPFTVTDPDVAVNFANPLVAYFGLQPNSVAGEGAYHDWASVSITGVAGVNASQDFTTSSSLSSDFVNFAQLPASLVFVTPTTPYWVRWTVPDTGFGLGAIASLNDNSLSWNTPGYYNLNNNIPVTTQMGPSFKWTLISEDALPTVDGQPFGTPSTNGFFRLSNPPPAQ